jgi:hypothetical protein
MRCRHENVLVLIPPTTLRDFPSHYEFRFCVRWIYLYENDGDVRMSVGRTIEIHTSRKATGIKLKINEPWILDGCVPTEQEKKRAAFILRFKRTSSCEKMKSVNVWIHYWIIVDTASCGVNYRVFSDGSRWLFAFFFLIRVAPFLLFWIFFLRS